MDNNNELQLSTNKYTISVISEIRILLDSSRKNVATQVNQELLSTYWRIGEIIVCYEHNDTDLYDYFRLQEGKSILMME